VPTFGIASALQLQLNFGSDQLQLGFSPNLNTTGPISITTTGGSYDDQGGFTRTVTGGFVEDATLISTTRLPAAFPLFAGGLGLVSFLARRRKQKALRRPKQPA
jgi:hypothetical protein